jgi:hypothetical protein
MTSEYNHRNPAYESRYIAAQTQDFIHAMKESKKANPIYKNDVSFYTSPVKNSHLYPNISHIRPFNLDYTPSNLGAMIDKTIKDKQSFAFGPYIIKSREINYKS